MRMLQKQGQAHRAFLEKKLERSETRLKSLEEELAIVRKKLDAEETLRKEAEERARTAQEELKTQRHAKKEEKKVVAMEAQKAIDAYLQLLMGAGEEADSPKNISVNDSLAWLANELDILGDHMAIGREYASIESLRAFAQSIIDSGCKHFGSMAVKEAKAYWACDLEASAAAIKFFDAF
jgi:hypothetical protein